MGLVKGNGNRQRKRRKRYYERDLNGLLQQLDDPDPAERRWAARDLSRHPEAAEALCHRLQHEDAGAVREAILASLLEIGGPTVVKGLLPLLRSEDAALRNGVIEVLQVMPDDVAGHVEVLLADEDSDVRIFAADIVRVLPHPEAPAWLCQALKTEAHVNVVGTIIDGLAEIGTPDVEPVLSDAAARFSDEPYVTFAVATALARLRGG